MHLHTERNGTLVVTSNTVWLDTALLIGAAICALPLIAGALHGTFATSDVTALMGSAIFVLGLLTVHERGRFEFDSRAGLVQWMRTQTFAKQSGSIPFAGVTSVALHTSLGSDGESLRYRLTLMTNHGELPLTIGYTTGKHDEDESIATSIRTLLQLSPSPADPESDSVPLALDQG